MHVATIKARKIRTKLEKLVVKIFDGGDFRSKYVFKILDYFEKALDFKLTETKEGVTMFKEKTLKIYQFSDERWNYDYIVEVKVLTANHWQNPKRKEISQSVLVTIGRAQRNERPLNWTNLSAFGSLRNYLK